MSDQESPNPTPLVRVEVIVTTDNFVEKTGYEFVDEGENMQSLVEWEIKRTGMRMIHALRRKERFRGETFGVGESTPTSR